MSAKAFFNAARVSGTRCILTSTIASVATIVVGMPGIANATTECNREVRQVWINVQDGAVWVCFTNDEGCVYLDGPPTSPGPPPIVDHQPERQEMRDRLFSLGLTAYSTGATVRVRYATSGYDCTIKENRNDFIGMWITQ